VSGATAGSAAGAANSSAVYSSLREVGERGAIVSIGNFDGVHRGHRELLARMRTLADEQSRPALVITFFPPTKVVFSDAHYLSSAEEKVELLSAFAPADIVVLPFDRDYANTDKSVFLAQLRSLAPHTIVVGEDFRFGHQRAGGLDDLRSVANEVEAFGLVTVGGAVVRSSGIRAALQSGAIDVANRLLGEPYPVSGTVVSGARRGRTIGYPTANIVCGERKALPIGVFAVSIDTPAGNFLGMANVGPRPSFPDEPPSLEVNIFDFVGDLYDQRVTTRFHAYLRSQRKFAGLDELKTQLAADEAAARSVLISGV